MSPPPEGPVAMVLAAGFGTRLRPLTEELPKPLVVVGDRSVLSHVCDTLAAGGVRRAVINAHHLAERYDGSLLESLALPVAMVQEHGEILGTAGGVAGAREALGPGPVVVHNGDILATLDLATLIAHQAASGALATLAVGPSRGVGEGTVGLDDEGRVVRLRGHVFGRETRGADYAGVQVIAEAGRARLPRVGCLVGDVYIPALAEGGHVNAAEVVEAFSDVGTLEEYGEANMSWLDRRGLPSWVAPDAEVVGSAQLDRTLVGARARVVGQGRVRRCIVWPGATLEAPAFGIIATPSGARVPWKSDEARGAAAPR
ncbi:MAG TPA: NDP-sugar synthase [Polyangiaceae bacterium]|nr:NDP-sugar synthase [Polyangiaceae bacterium]